MSRRGYPPEFRRRMVDLVEGGRKVSEFAAEFEVSEKTIYTWRQQAQVEAGLSSSEHAELAAAKRRIRELETELAIHRRATELLKEKSHPMDVRGDQSDRRRSPISGIRNHHPGLRPDSVDQHCPCPIWYADE